MKARVRYGARLRPVVFVASIASVSLLTAAASPATPLSGCASARAFRPGPLGAVAYVRGHTLHVVDLSSGRDRTLATIPP